MIDFAQGQGVRAYSLTFFVLAFFFGFSSTVSKKNHTPSRSLFSKYQPLSVEPSAVLVSNLCSSRLTSGVQETPSERFCHMDSASGHRAGQPARAAGLCSDEEKYRREVLAWVREVLPEWTAQGETILPEFEAPSCGWQHQYGGLPPLAD